MDEILFLFLVSPKNFEKLTSVIVAPDRETAKGKARNNPAIKELTDMGIELTAVNVTSGMLSQGYNLEITKSVMFH
jgi:hypothetical protein